VVKGKKGQKAGRAPIEQRKKVREEERKYNEKKKKNASGRSRAGKLVVS